MTISVNLDLNCAFVNGARVRLKPQHAEILSMLTRRPVTDDGIWAGLYGARPECDLPKGQHVVKVLISQLRQRLRPHGVEIRKVYGKAYVLEDEPIVMSKAS